MPAASWWFRYPISPTCSTAATSATRLNASSSTRRPNRSPPPMCAGSAPRLECDTRVHQKYLILIHTWLRGWLNAKLSHRSRRVFQLLCRIRLRSVADRQSLMKYKNVIDARRDGTRRHIWLCADDYGMSPAVNVAIRDLVVRGRINATSVMVIAPNFNRFEAVSLNILNASETRVAIGLHVT